MKRCFFVFILMVCHSFLCLATHNRAGEITFRQTGLRTYEVTITTYTKTDAPADRCDLVIQWGDGSSSTLYRSNGPADRGCKWGGEPIYNLIKKNIYKGTHTYSSPGNYKVSMMDYNRNEGVKNIPGSVTVPFYIESYIYVSSDASVENSSVQLLNPPTDFGCIYTPFIHSLGAYDSDGDSLAYKLVNCRGLDGMELENIYSATYNLDASHISIDHQGTITWDSPNAVGEFNIAVEITEYRRNRSGEYYPIGKVLRDMQIDITDCKNNPPSITAADSYCVTAGESVTFDVYASDTDGDSLMLTMVGGTFLGENPSVFTTRPADDGGLAGTYFWTPLCSQARKAPYILTVKANDAPVDKNGNPLSGLSAQKTISLTVLFPAPTLRSVTPSEKSDAMDIKWDAPSCGDVTSYNIYRKKSDGSLSSVSCSGGVDSSEGYEWIGNTNLTSFRDEGEEGFDEGMAYCYVVTALNEETESSPSSPLCATIPLRIPVICGVSVLKTHASDGEVEVRWSRPQEIDRMKFPPPYTYVLHAVSPSGGDSVIFSRRDENDTSFVHRGVDTRHFIPLSYYVELINDEGYIGKSPVASSFFLNAAAADRSVLLSTAHDVPWSVDSVTYHTVEDGRNIPALTVMGDGRENVRVADKANGVSYSFVGEVHGHYDHGGIHRPIVCFTQVADVIPSDNEVECPPSLSINQGCDSPLPFSLFWSDPSVDCSADGIAGYMVYHRMEDGDEWELVYRGGERSMDIPSNMRYGQYMVRAEDTAGNVSLPSNVVDVVHCAVVSLPNVFTPNGDGVNDVFTPLAPLEEGDFHIDVFSRWGNKVFSTDDPAIMWNGRRNGTGKECSEGVYFYVFSFVPSEGGEKQKGSGFVHIFR